MSLNRIVAPVGVALSLEDARLHLRVDAWGSPPSHPEDALIESYVAAATAEIDGSHGWLGRALLTQTWRLALPRFPLGRTSLRIPLPPLQSISSLQYRDTGGTLVTMVAGTDYTLNASATPTATIEPPRYQSWPATDCVEEAVLLTFVAGYGAAASSLPEPIRQWLRLRVGTYYAYREADAAGPPVPADSYASMLSNYRVRGAWLGELP